MKHGKYIEYPKCFYNLTGLRRINVTAIDAYLQPVRRYQNSILSPRLSPEFSICAIFSAMAKLLEHKNLEELAFDVTEDGHFSDACIAVAMQRGRSHVRCSLRKVRPREAKEGC